MPTGTQQELQNLFCISCSEVLEELGNIHDSICQQCEEEFASECGACGEVAINYTLLSYESSLRFRRNRVPNTEFYSAEDSGEMLCVDCINSCPNCDSIFQYEDSIADCCEPEPPSCINFYSYTPVYRFWDMINGDVDSSYRAKDDILYMGVELEVAKMTHLAQMFHDDLTTEESVFLYMKEDGSIGYSGVELVTMPATLDAFKAVFPFDSLDRVRALGARSYAYESCGFHIHVSRSAFSATHMWKFIKFQLNNPVLCQQVAQRAESSYATWYYDNEEVSSLPDYVKGKRSNGRRYLAINFQNRATVELRYFKGNILKGAILKNLEFVQSIYDYTKYLSVRNVMAGGLTESNYMEWLHVVAEDYPNLYDYLNNDKSKEIE